MCYGVRLLTTWIIAIYIVNLFIMALAPNAGGNHVSYAYQPQRVGAQRWRARHERGTLPMHKQHRLTREDACVSRVIGGEHIERGRTDHVWNTSNIYDSERRTQSIRSEIYSLSGNWTLIRLDRRSADIHKRPALVLMYVRFDSMAAAGVKRVISSMRKSSSVDSAMLYTRQVTSVRDFCITYQRPRKRLMSKWDTEGGRAQSRPDR